MNELTKYYKTRLTGFISRIDGTRPLEVPEVEGKEGNVLFNDTQHILFTVIWRQAYGKGPLR